MQVRFRRFLIVEGVDYSVGFLKLLVDGALAVLASTMSA